MIDALANSISVRAWQARARGDLRVLLALAAVYLIWGSTYLAMRLALGGFAPFRMAGLRFLIAGIVYYVFLRVRGAPAPNAKEWAGATLVGILLLVCGNGLVAYAEQSLASSFAAIAISTVPLWTALLSAVLGERPSRLEWIGLAIGFGGAIVLNLGGELGAGPIGATLAILIAPLCWALGVVLGRRLPLPKGAMAPAAEMLAAGVLMLGLSLTVHEAPRGSLTWEATLALGYLVVFGSLVGFSAFQYLLNHPRPAVVTSYAYVNPLIAALLGVLFAGETLGATAGIGGAIIAAALLLLSAARQR